MVQVFKKKLIQNIDFIQLKKSIYYTLNQLNYLGVLKKCDCFMTNCNTCQATAQCSKCFLNYFLFDNDLDGFYDTCIKCDNISGCEDTSIIFENFNPDGSGF